MNQKPSLLLLTLLLFLVSLAKAQGYEGIVPITSSCADVEKVLKIKACQLSKISYKAAKEEVEIFFSTRECDRIFQTRWNVPIGTVIGIHITFKSYIPLEELKVNLGEFEKSYSDIEVYYRSEKKGMEFAVQDDTEVVTLFYFPSSENKNIVCKDEKSG